MSKYIIAVDEDEKILDLIAETFKDKPEIELSLISDGNIALEEIKKSTPDIVITAIDISGIDGLEIIKEAKKNNIKTIVLTSRDDEGTMDMIKSYYKPDRYLTKPLDNYSLFNQVNDLLNQKSSSPNIPINDVCSLFKGLCDSIEEGIVILDPELNIVWLNKALEKKGFKFENVIRRKSYEVFDSKNSPEKDNTSILAFQDGKVHKKLKKGIDGRSYLLTSIPVIEGNNVIYVIEFGEDISNKEELIREINKK